jgi:hypothetical protein
VRESLCIVLCLAIREPHASLCAVSELVEANLDKIPPFEVVSERDISASEIGEPPPGGIGFHARDEPPNRRALAEQLPVQAVADADHESSKTLRFSRGRTGKSNFHGLA